MFGSDPHPVQEAGCGHQGYADSYKIDHTKYVFLASKNPRRLYKKPGKTSSYFVIETVLKTGKDNFC